MCIRDRAKGVLPSFGGFYPIVSQLADNRIKAVEAWQHTLGQWLACERRKQQHDQYIHRGGNNNQALILVHEGFSGIAQIRQMRTIACFEIKVLRVYIA